MSRVVTDVVRGALPRWLREFSPASQLCATPPLRRLRPRVCGSVVRVGTEEELFGM